MVGEVHPRLGDRVDGRVVGHEDEGDHEDEVVRDDEDGDVEVVRGMGSHRSMETSFDCEIPLLRQSAERRRRMDVRHLVSPCLQRSPRRELFD